MTLFLFFLRSYWKHILIVVVVIAISAFMYKKVYNIGYSAANVECAEKIALYEQKMTLYKTALDDRIKLLEETAITLVNESLDARKSLKKDYSTILATVKNKPLTVIEKDNCKPSPDFIRVYNEAVNRANK